MVAAPAPTSVTSPVLAFTAATVLSLLVYVSGLLPPPPAAALMKLGPPATFFTGPESAKAKERTATEELPLEPSPPQAASVKMGTDERRVPTRLRATLIP